MHLLQRCNLNCAHCYSDSGPSARAELSLEDALGAVALGARLGYTHLAVSGGEPLLYPHLEAVIDCAKTLGQHVSVVTNGLLATRAVARRRLAGADSVCVSLDGAQATHDALRRRAGAYVGALRAVEALRAAGMPCGMACGVVRRSLDDLEEVTAAAVGAGASFLNFHAVEPAGRGQMLAPQHVLDRAGQTLLFVAVHLLMLSDISGCAVHCDLVHKDRVAASPHMVYAGSDLLDAIDSTAARLGVLVVEPSGRLSPVSYGFPAAWSLGSLRQALDTDGDSVRRTLPRVGRALNAAGVALLQELHTEDDWVVLNPSAELSRLADRVPNISPMAAHDRPVTCLA
ncbi:MAG: radical SAM protein [Ideonella sp.]|nr:radical SAM protein [Ideonella sp.]